MDHHGLGGGFGCVLRLQVEVFDIDLAGLEVIDHISLLVVVPVVVQIVFHFSQVGQLSFSDPATDLRTATNPILRTLVATETAAGASDTRLVALAMRTRDCLSSSRPDA